MTASEVRECLEGLPCPICTAKLEDNDLERILEEVDAALTSRFGVCLLAASDKVDAAWWEELERAALEAGGVYYEDLD